jgi:N-acetylmuramoyl-L-alanine amidase
MKKRKTFFNLFFILIIFILILSLFLYFGKKTYSEENIENFPKIIQDNLYENYFNFIFIINSFNLVYNINYEDKIIYFYNKDSSLPLKISINKNIVFYKFNIKTFSDFTIIIKKDDNKNIKNYNYYDNVFINSDIIFYFYNLFFKNSIYKNEFDKWYNIKKKIKELKFLEYKPLELNNLISQNSDIFIQEKNEKTENKEKKDEVIISKIISTEEKKNDIKNYYDYAKKEIIEFKKIKYIIIDPGHGGKDPGAVVGNLKEKDINLKISLFLRDELIKKFPDLKIVLTRTDDKYLSLEERVKFVNSFISKEYTGIMISIHCNSNPFSNKSNGLEVYFLDYQIADEKIKNLVSEENKSENKESNEDFNFFVNRILNENLIYSSNYLAKLIFESFKNKNSIISPNKISGAPFYVIAYSEMPSVLIELGYLTNPNDSKNILSTKFINDFINSVVEAISFFINKYNITKGFKD